jgi:hypothetical protein
MDAARENFARNLRVTLKRRESLVVDELKKILHSGAGGQTQVVIDYANDDARVRMVLPPSWRVHPSGRLMGELKLLPGVVAVQCEYDSSPGQRLIH